MTTDIIIPQALSLEDLSRHSVRALVRRFHLNRDWIIGLVGDRGAGKSLGGANIAIRDFAMNDEPLWSNMQIRHDVDIPDFYAKAFGLEAGGVVPYLSEHIDKQAFLAMDERYEGGCLFFDEFNLEYGESRRSSANVNLMTDRAIQQLRKMQCGLIYTVLNEVYVDTRIRENTDLFIRCSDVAFKPNNLRQHMKQGIQFEWMLHPMSAKVCGIGNTYSDTNKPIGPWQVTMGHLHGSIDTYERQAQGRTSYTDKSQLVPMNIKEDAKVEADHDAWGWLDKRLLDFYAKHISSPDIIEMTKDEFREALGIEKRQWGATVCQLEYKIPNLEDNNKTGKYQRFYIPNRMAVLR